MLIIFSLLRINIDIAITMIPENTQLSIETFCLQFGLFSLPATEHQQGENTWQSNGGGGLFIIKTYLRHYNTKRQLIKLLLLKLRFLRCCFE